MDVELVLELRNTSAKELRIWTTGDYRDEKAQAGGDYVELVLDLKGPGAVGALVARRNTRPLTPPPAVTALAPGKRFRLPITSLGHGRQGVAAFEGRRACWAQPGDYVLTATFKTAVSPALKGAKETRWVHFAGGHVTVTAPPVKLKVVEANKKP